jgi:hypothetical protein
MRFSNFNGHINKAKKAIARILKKGSTIELLASTVAKNKQDFAQTYIALVTKKMLIDKKETNIYIESDNLLKFLSDTKINKSSIENLKKMLLDSMGVESSCTYAIHLPNKANSIALRIELFDAKSYNKLNNNQQVFAASMLVRDDWGFFKFDGLPWDKDNSSKEFNVETEIEWKICLNFLMYISAFPDLLVNEAPSIAMIRPQGSSRTLKETCGISNYLKDDVSPHFRRGHFRILRHERFGENKMKSVYVKPCFVGHNSATLVA